MVAPWIKKKRDDSPSGQKGKKNEFEPLCTLKEDFEFIHAGVDGLALQPLQKGTDHVSAVGRRMDIFEKRVWPVISSFFSPTARVLDLGCGVGRHSRFISKYVSHVTALDAAVPERDGPNHRGYDVRLIKDISNIEFVSANARRWTPEILYDIIFCHTAFYQMHIQYGDEIFAKMLSMLQTSDSYIILIECGSQRKYNLEELVAVNEVTIVTQVFEATDGQHRGVDRGVTITVIHNK